MKPEPTLNTDKTPTLWRTLLVASLWLTGWLSCSALMAWLEP